MEKFNIVYINELKAEIERLKKYNGVKKMKCNECGKIIHRPKNAYPFSSKEKWTVNGETYYYCSEECKKASMDSFKTQAIYRALNG